MLRTTTMMAMLAACACVAASEARAVAASALLNAPVTDLRGEPIGAVDDLILDVDAGRVLYVIVEGRGRFFTLPARAFDQRLRLNMDLANAVARDKSPGDDPLFRRAARLIGQPVTNPGNGRIGVIDDIHLDLESGRVERVVVATDQGMRNMPVAVLAHGRFPPLTRWQVEHPTPDAEQGFLRRPPSDERKAYHDHQW